MNSWVSNLNGYIPTTLPFYKEQVDSHEIKSIILAEDEIWEDELILFQFPKILNTDLKCSEGVSSIGKLLVKESGKVTLLIEDVEYDL